MLSEKMAAQLPSDKNMFFSPMSIDIALAMLFEGTGGQLRTDLSQKLGFNDVEKERLTEIREFMKFFGVQKEKQNLRRRTPNHDKNHKDQQPEPFTQALNDGLFVDQNFKVKQNFIESLTKNFDSMVKSMSFAKDPNSYKIINNWVAESTNNKIKDLLQQLDPSTVLVLVNTIYFKANWVHPFQKEKTRKRDFITLKSTKTVDMMVSKIKRYPYMTDSKGNLFVEVSYESHERNVSKKRPLTSMVIMLPSKKNTDFSIDHTKEVIDLISLDSDKLYALQSVELHMPKFKIENKINLNDILAKLGLGELFKPGGDNFANISDSKNIAVSDVIHQSFIKVDEEGTEAAAATAIIMNRMAIMPDKHHKKIVVDRPFGFWIIEKNKKTVLFTGKVMDPTE